jgi:hypothetical protein
MEKALAFRLAFNPIGFSHVVPLTHKHIGPATNLAVFHIAQITAMAGVYEHAVDLKTKRTNKRGIHR